MCGCVDVCVYAGSYLYTVDGYPRRCFLLHVCLNRVESISSLSMFVYFWRWSLKLKRCSKPNGFRSERLSELDHTAAVDVINEPPHHRRFFHTLHAHHHVGSIFLFTHYLLSFRKTRPDRTRPCCGEPRYHHGRHSRTKRRHPRIVQKASHVSYR